MGVRQSIFLFTQGENVPYYRFRFGTEGQRVIRIRKKMVGLGFFKKSLPKITLFQKRFLTYFNASLIKSILFTEELERSLLRLEPLLVERLNAAETNRVLSAANNAPLLCLH
jgi:hypothetical protein